jgi:hypothetical protein
MLQFLLGKKRFYARVHFHANSGLIVANNASINVNGDASTTDRLENEVVF